MEDFLRGLFGALPSWARSLASPLVNRLLGIFRFFFGLARAIRVPWRVLVTAAHRLRNGLLSFAFEAYATLRWITLIKIPKVRAAIIAAIKLWAIAAIKLAVAPVVRLLNNLRAWAQLWVGRLIVRIAKLGFNLGKRITAVVLAIAKLNARVFGTWLTPARLAAWLAGAMWSVLWRYGLSNLDRFANYFWRRRQSILLRGVDIIEKQIGRLL